MIVNAVLAAWLTASLVVCPYTCAHFPRSCGSTESAVACECHDGACCEWGDNREESAGNTPAPEQPCSCPCVCKGALTECSARQQSGDGDSAQPALLVVCDAGTLLLDAPDSIQPDPPPPKILSGREIRALIASLRL